MYVNTKSDDDNNGAEILQENIEPLLMVRRGKEWIIK